MVSYIKLSDVRNHPIATGDVLVARTLSPGRFSPRRYAFQFRVLDATAWVPSTFQRIVVDGLAILFDATSNEVRVGVASAIATPTCFQLLLTLARAAPDIVPYEQLDHVTAEMNAASLDDEPWSTLYQRKRRTICWLQKHDIPLEVVTAYNHGYGLRRSN